jgi:hypothetical protein
MTCSLQVASGIHASAIRVHVWAIGYRLIVDVQSDFRRAQESSIVTVPNPSAPDSRFREQAPSRLCAVQDQDLKSPLIWGRGRRNRYCDGRV